VIQSSDPAGGRIFGGFSILGAIGDCGASPWSAHWFRVEGLKSARCVPLLAFIGAIDLAGAGDCIVSGLLR
jgi:hypothetical protein